MKKHRKCGDDTFSQMVNLSVKPKDNEVKFENTKEVYFEQTFNKPALINSKPQTTWTRLRLGAGQRLNDFLRFKGQTNVKGVCFFPVPSVSRC